MIFDNDIKSIQLRVDMNILILWLTQGNMLDRVEELWHVFRKSCKNIPYIITLHALTDCLINDMLLPSLLHIIIKTFGLFDTLNYLQYDV